MIGFFTALSVILLLVASAGCVSWIYREALDNSSVGESAFATLIAVALAASIIFLIWRLTT